MAKVVESDRNCDGPERGDAGLKIHQKKDFLFVVGASNKCSFFVLCPFLDRSHFFLNKQLKVARGSEIQREVIDGSISLVANKEVEL